jgi:hypothetical protein
LPAAPSAYPQQTFFVRANLGAQAPLFFPVSAALHAAPLPALTLAGVDLVGVAVEGVTLSNSLARLVDQRRFDGERTGMQRAAIACLAWRFSHNL